MPPAVLALLVVHYACLLWLAASGVQRLAQVWARARRRAPPPARAPREWPHVTVQLPLYNEPLVAARVIEAAAAMDYPRDRLSIHVLDDSTDGTRAIVDDSVAALAAAGRRARVVRRPHRAGFKAGALQHALPQAEGELIAVFDADFVPPEHFLKELVGHFDEPAVAVVQARWGHLNRPTNLLTRAQAGLLDGHFAVEQVARSRAGLPFNFNGTAGILRRAAIQHAGGWAHDTLTEDLDLSYRAQLRGWEFVYRPDVVAPAELPADVAGLLSQQHRWAKGAIECLRKLSPQIVAPGPRPLRWRLAALAHLTANLSYLALAGVAVSLPLVAWARQRVDLSWLLGMDVALALVGFGGTWLFYFAAARWAGARWLAAPRDATLALALDIGLSLHKARAVLEALVGHTSPFVRTPKLALVGRQRVRARLTGGGAAAGAGVAAAAGAAWMAWGLSRIGDGPFPTLSPVPFLALFSAGFATVAIPALARAGSGWRGAPNRALPLLDHGQP